MQISEETINELRALSGVALVHGELKHALTEICEIASRAVPHADGASLTTFSAAGPEASASSDPWAEGLDEMQYSEHEGPCIDAARSGLMCRVRDTGSEKRWPSYMPRAHGEGALSMISAPMTVESKTTGALNVYSRKVDAFGPEEASLAEIIAGHASLASQVTAALHGHRDLAEQLQTAMTSRAVIEQAKGIIMATVGCGPDAAYERLVQQSQHENRKLRDVADELVRTHGRSER